MNLRANRLILMIATATAAGLLVPAGAGGSPIGDKQAQASQLEAQISANGQKADALSEQINGATLRLNQAQANEDAAQAQINQAQARATALKHQLASRAADIYMGAGNSDPLSAVDVKSIGDLAARSKYADAAANHDSSLVDQLNQAKDDLNAKKQQFDAAKKQARGERDSLLAAKNQVAAANATQQQLLGQVKGEIATLVAQDQKAKDAANAAKAQRMFSGDSGGGGGGGGGMTVDPGSIPAPSAAAARAVSIAYQQLGKPYVYAAAGPDSFDCSGLVMYAYGLAGVSLPHYSGAQYDDTVHIPMSAAQPGDLIFFGPGGSEHVGIYIGGGQMIHAPHTGDVVRIAAIWETPSGVGRVRA